MNSEARSILLWMIAGAALASAVEYWQRERPIPLAPATRAQPAAASSAPAPYPTLTPPPAFPAPPASPAPAPRSAGVDRSAATANPPAETGSEGQPEEPLPVAFHIRNRRELSLIDGDIRNIASKPLSITLRAVNARSQTASEIRFELAPGERRTYSSNDGLNMQTDDQLVVQSPPFQERVFRVP